MTVAYDGSSYCGFAAQPGLRTVAGTLNEALSRLLGHPSRCAAPAAPTGCTPGARS